MTLKFGEWLAVQRDREDFIGDIARVPGMQLANVVPSRRKNDEHKKWVDIVIKLAEPGHVEGFNEAWQEFLLAKQAAADGPAQSALLGTDR